jgi:hypothetical protein
VHLLTRVFRARQVKMRAGIGVRSCHGPDNVKHNTSCYWVTTRQVPDQLSLQVFRDGDENDKALEQKYFHRPAVEEVADEQYADHDAVWEDFSAKMSGGEIKANSDFIATAQAGLACACACA